MSTEAGGIPDCFEAGTVGRWIQAKRIFDENTRFSPEWWALWPTGSASVGANYYSQRRGTGIVAPDADVGLEWMWLTEKTVHWRLGFKFRGIRQYVWKCIETDPCLKPPEIDEYIRTEYGKWYEIILGKGTYHEILQAGESTGGNLPVPKRGKRR